MSFNQFVTIRPTQSHKNKQNNSDICLDQLNDTTSDEFISNTSLPNLSTLDNTLLLDLKNDIQNLKTQLEIAHNEVDKLNEENYNLKKQLDSKNTQIKILKSLGSEPHLSNTSTPLSTKKKYLYNKNQTVSVTPMKSMDVRTSSKSNNKICSQDNIISSNKTDCEVQHKKLDGVYSNRNDPNKLIGPSEGRKTQSQIINAVPGKHEGNVYIVGNEKVCGLSAYLINSRKNQWNDYYKISAMVKPGATCKEIFSHFDSIQKYITQNDRVILSFGTVERNPFEVLKELSIVLYKLRKTKVFILPVSYNPYINTDLLNDFIYSISRTFNNCFFMSPHTRTHLSIFRKHTYLQKITHAINHWIDLEDYKNIYLNNVINIGKKYFNFTNNKNNIYSSNSNTKEMESKKGTIPYYFKKQQNLTVKNVQSLEIKPSPKKGTIPFYFQNTQEKDFFRAQ